MRQQTLGQYLRALRVNRKLTQAQLAQRAQVSIRAISYWEKDEYKPRRYEVQSILTALEVSAQEQASVLLNMMPLRGEKLVRSDVALRAVAQELPFPGAGDLLAAMRLRKGWTSEEAAQRLKVATATFSRWENNRFDISEAMLPHIQRVFHASEAEMAALRQRMVLTVEAEEPFSLEQCHQWVDIFGQSLYTDASRGIDLDALALQRKLWLLTTRHPETRQAFGRATLFYAGWLLSQNRGGEVSRQAQRAVDAFAGNVPRDNSMAYALNLLSRCRVFRTQSRPEQGERFLRRWLSYLQPPAAQISVLADLGLYASMAGRSDAAMRYLQEARNMYALPGNATEARHAYLQLTHARILMYIGKSLQAYEALTQLIAADAQGRDSMDIIHALMFIEIMLAAGERNLAQSWLDSVYARLETQGSPRARMNAEKLAQRL